MSITVQTGPIDAPALIAGLTAAPGGAGALVTFSGLVRGAAGLILEHYPGMTEAALAGIEAEALRRWPLSGSLIVHRYGAMREGEVIVLVAALSAHRRAAFEAADFMMDHLKSNAPFWKKEGESWIEADPADLAALDRWRT